MEVCLSWKYNLSGSQNEKYKYSVNVVECHIHAFEFGTKLVDKKLTCTIIDGSLWNYM
jgi:hypothetical protein